MPLRRLGSFSVRGTPVMAERPERTRILDILAADDEYTYDR
jgi:hypothetical protein